MAEAVSVGVTEPGDLMIMYGSTAFMLLVLEGGRRSQPDLWTTAGCFNGRYGISGGMATAGALTTWFRSVFGPTSSPRKRPAARTPTRRWPRRRRHVPPGAGGLVALPYFAGERTPLFDPEARGVIAGLSLLTGRGEVYRALLEGIAYGIRHNLEAWARPGRRCDGRRPWAAARMPRSGSRPCPT